MAVQPVTPPTVDLSTPPPELAEPEPEPEPEPSISITALADRLDVHQDDVAGFINDILSPHLPKLAPGAPPKPPDLVPLDKGINELLTRLSLLSQDTSSALEQLIHDISRTVPRLTYDLQFMRESATSLQSSLSLVQARVTRQTNLEDGTSDEAKTHKALEKLTHLDKLKTRMESARDILREAESWSTLESEITSLIATSSWDKAGERLAEASRSMVVFQNTPAEYETKRTLLVSLQNELETALGAALKESIQKNDIEQVAKFYDVFELMEREQEFQNFYFASRRAAVVDEWNAVVLLDTAQTAAPEVGTPVKFSSFLPKFYTSLLAVLSSERTHVPLIFPPHLATSILSTFLQTTLDGLSPSIQTRLSSVADFYGPEALSELIKAFTATEELAIGVQGVLDTMAFNTQGGVASGSALASPSPPAGSPTTPSDRRSTLKRMPISRRFSRTPGAVAETTTSVPSVWETTLYEPFLDFQASYANLERRYLSQQLKYDPSLNATSSSRGKDDASRLLMERATAAFGLAEEAIKRCLAFTHGYGSPGLLDALNAFFSGFLESNQTFILDLAGRSAGLKSGAADELDFEGLDYSTEDWGTFQLGLHILETCRSVRDRLTAFEEKLLSSLMEISSILRITPSDPSSFKLNDTTLGAIALLQQSPLNSADLHHLTASERIALSSAREGLSSFTRASQAFLQNIILSPLRAQLHTYPNLSVWSQADKPQRRGELQIPSFSLSPTDTIARVSEGLLNLLRIFEVYAADSALAYSLETLPFIDVESLRALLEPAKQSVMMPEDPTSESSPAHATGLTPEMVLSTWISSLALSLLSTLTSMILPSIKTLSTQGAAQLESDLGYLSNAVRALDVEWEELERWREASAIKGEEEWRGKVRDARASGGVDVLEKVGRMRGWPT
ncbi:Golgi complex component 7-domain-containing protein [Naematelia encephala]|uniref:Conserved oligomeric Golgi complex subunit 7 n=1 Tax=Naematelia encephala TaxID=71784 RepID=A0A1Y2ANJ1_9TREE|nr:Golgi complex component 7-domain-containing protein [Naematelia encephala]